MRDDFDLIVNKVRELTKTDEKVMVNMENPFGDGKASIRIVDALINRKSYDEGSARNEN